ncbi:hypothetical protein N7532_001689 [Penicillium argentinense]|uniref:Haloacid dehalogenase-like hydrolase n=1 Tax=Penicillium argentinense TaxID=1131581 RepID=A0A9W9G303_9EURO|nr:uncharacterized protein N7532_001689 [Penicillium argentinense]KAJ5111154.1 hypothetical protein N7532_001689 [Penicillium argentinense]
MSTSSLNGKAAASRILLLTFDAFGTLFHPRIPVPELYVQVACKYGLSQPVITPQRLKSAFKETFLAQSKRYPNYGRADVLRGQYGGPKQWWQEVIEGSFARTLAGTAADAQDGKFKLPDGMVDHLLELFAGKGGYAEYPEVLRFFEIIRWMTYEPLPSNSRFDRIILGVISNSDDRVPAVLRALGINVADMRADQDVSSKHLPGFEYRGGIEEPFPPEDAFTPPKEEPPPPQEEPGSEEPPHQPRQRREKSPLEYRAIQLMLIEQELKTNLKPQQPIGPPRGIELKHPGEIHLVITSYEAGEEKPNRSIFDVAKRQARLIMEKERDSILPQLKAAQRESELPARFNPDGEWTCVHVGDDFEKDYCGARDAGWESYLLAREEGQKRGDDVKTISSLYGLLDLCFDRDHRPRERETPKMRKWLDEAYVKAGK